MLLPGNYTLGFLEEDIPLKAYFRFKPLFVKGEDGYQKYSGMAGAFPDEGYIRIVPDKNESSRFKSRMRVLGRYCALDLTTHPNENDKIRPNKNYAPERQETNRCIVYSDVITFCARDILCEAYRAPLTPAEGIIRLNARIPGTYHVVLISDGKITGPYCWSAPENCDFGEIRLAPDEDYARFEIPESPDCGLYPLVLNDNLSVEVLLSKTGQTLFTRITPEPEAPLAAPLAEEAEAEPLVPVASVPEAVPPAPDIEAPAPAAVPPAPVVEAPAPVIQKPAPAAETPAAVPLPPAPPRAIWMRPSEERVRTIMNPRRGRGLSEVVDDLWRKSRIDQLGHPIPGEATGQPAVSPIDQAVNDAKRAWALPEARGALIDGLMSIEGLSENIAGRFPGGAVKPLTSRQIDGMNDLEAERLKLLGEIDTLRMKRVERREELMEELRQAHASEIARMESASKRLKEECEQRLKSAEAARTAEVEAQRALENAVKDKFERGLMDHAIYSRAAKLIRKWDGEDYSDYTNCPPVYEPAAGQLLTDVRVSFENAGYPLTNDEAVNLLACLSLGRVIVLSGETGSGKSAIANTLISALGLNIPGMKRMAAIEPGKDCLREDSGFKALTQYEDMRTLRVALIDDANTVESLDVTRGLMTYAEDPARTTALRVLLTVQDDQMGYPLSPRLLDRAFFLRLPAAGIGGGQWKPKTRKQPAPGRAVSLDALNRIFTSNRELPGEIDNRMQIFIDKLSHYKYQFSGRTLADMYAFCMAVTPLITDAPRAALDMAIAQRGLPKLLATASVDVLHALPELLPDMPRSLSLLSQPLPLPPL